MKMLNMTPHEVCFVTDNTTVKVAPSGVVARVATRTETIGNIDGVPVTATVYGEVENLPAPEEETIYIVSSLVAARCKDRTDVFIPNEPVRDPEGRIVGCKSLGRV